MIKSPEIWAKLNVHMNNPDVEHGTYREQIYAEIFQRKEQEEYLENMMMLKAISGNDFEKAAKEYTNTKFPWKPMIEDREEMEAAEILEEESGKTYEVVKNPITKEK